MTTAIRRYATRESTVDAIQWNGSDSAYYHLKAWAGADVTRDSTNNVLFQSEGSTELLPVGNYLVRVGDYLYSFTPQELADDYVRTFDD